MSMQTRTVLLIAISIIAAGSFVQAHDPGLSSLDVTIDNGRVVASLTMSATDVALVAGGAEPRRAVTRLALDAITIAVDGVRVPGTIGSVTTDKSGARVDQSFAIATSTRHRVEISSTVATRVARGHRQLLVVHASDRTVLERLLDEKSPAAAIDLDAVTPSAVHVAGHYVELGVHHILTGYDHLVFLAGLILTARRTRELLIALTAFTAAHSISLALVVIAGVHAPPAIVEPLIALSIAWVGVDILLSDAASIDREDLSTANRRRARWLVVFGFGLIHGFGFAGALLDLGLGSSTSAIAAALISFNVGVESGQLVVSGIVLPVVWLMRSHPTLHARLLRICSLAITAVGTYWLVDRLG